MLLKYSAKILRTAKSCIHGNLCNRFGCKPQKFLCLSKPQGTDVLLTAHSCFLLKTFADVTGTDFKSFSDLFNTDIVSPVLVDVLNDFINFFYFSEIPCQHSRFFRKVQ